MEKIVDYTPETRDAIIAEQEALGFWLIEEQSHFDGLHLVFENGESEPPPRDLEAEIDEMKAKMIVSEPTGNEIKVPNLVYDPDTKEVKYKEAL